MPAAERTNDDHRHFRVGVDVGGTFTDVVLVEETTGEILVAKVATVPADPSEGCIDAIDKAIRNYSLRPGQFVFTVHGTTIATNTIIEGKGAKAGLITSEGFRDVLEIAYQTRPKLYDIFYDKAKPLIPRYLCQGVPERIDGDGVVLVPLDEDAVRRVARQLAGEGVEAIAVALLHAYKDPAHERRIGEILAEDIAAHADRPVLRHQPGIPRVSAHLDGRGQCGAAAARRTLCCAVGGAARRARDQLRPPSDELVRRNHRGERRQAASRASGGIGTGGGRDRRLVHRAVVRLQESAGARHRRHDGQGRAGQQRRCRRSPISSRSALRRLRP